MTRSRARSNVRGAVTIGTAGWSLPRDAQGEFDPVGTHLERYASRLRGVEINSSFYRAHRPATYARWAASVPAGFRFAVKVPKTITHERALTNAESLLDDFLAEAAHLGGALGPLLVQLPPSQKFDDARASEFFRAFRERFGGAIVIEPRHPTWFAPDADALLRRYRVAGVAADPAPVPLAAEPRGDPGVVYHRLHGSPVIYRSNYERPRLTGIRDSLLAAATRGADAWCIFDNTANGHATTNALELTRLLAGKAA